MNSATAEIIALLEDAPAAIAVHRGAELRWQVANALYRRLLGNRQLVGLCPSDVLPDWAQLHRVLGAVVESRQPYIARAQRFLVDRAGGGQLVEGWFDIVCSPLFLPDGTVDGVVTVMVDLSEEVQARQRAETLAGELARAVEARDEFLSVASHELRTPLTALRLQVEMLGRRVRRGDVPTPADLKTHVANTGKQIMRLVELMDTLLDVTRLQGTRLDLRLDETDLADLADEVVTRTRPLALAAGSSLTLQTTALRGRWDRSRVDQILTNLLSNAIKYGAGQPIAVTVTSRSDLAAVLVEDRGIGIAPEDHPRIFQRFERAASRVHFGGLGLGLWISRQLAEAMGGTLTVDSVPGAGARFTLLLPL